MAEPEWKQKFREIGQKGEEEVTEVTEGGIKKETSTPRRDASTPVSKPAGYKSPAKPAETMSDDKKEDAEVPLEAGDDEDAAAMFAAAGESESAVEEEVVEEEVVEEEVVEEEVVEEEVVEDEEEVKEVIDLTAVEEPEDPAFDPEDPEAQKELLNDVPPNKRSAMKCFLPFLCFAILAGVGIATGYFVFGRETITAAPTKAPISYIDFDENEENYDIICKDKQINNINLGKIPIMVNSNYCVLNKQLELKKNNECLYDHGGYFIINGNEKVVVSQDRIAENKTYVFKETGPMQIRPKISSGVPVGSVYDGIISHT